MLKDAKAEKRAINTFSISVNYNKGLLKRILSETDNGVAANLTKRLVDDIGLSNESSDTIMSFRRCLLSYDKDSSNSSIVPISSHESFTDTVQIDDYTYKGFLRNGLPNGFGIQIFPDGDRYEGNFVDGKRTGKGMYTWADGGYYDGDWKDGGRTGYGIHTRANGDYHEGFWSNNVRTGKAISYWADHSFYYGEWKEDLRSGKAIDFWSCDNCYEGCFENHEFHGKGSY
jgi:hypothetical protein